MQNQCENFRYKTNDSKEILKQKYQLHLQKAKILYFSSKAINKRSFRKNSELLSDFNIFKIKKKQNVKYQKISGQHEKKNMKKTTTQIAKLFAEEKESEFTLEKISTLLNIDKRKIYDLVNVMNTIQLISKKTKGVYQWNGLESCLDTLDKIPEPHKVKCLIKEESALNSLTLIFLSIIKNLQEANINEITEKIQQVCP